MTAPDDVAAWLAQIGLPEYAPIFAEHAIDREVLADLNDQDLKDLGVPLGHRKKLLKAIAALDADEAAPRSGGARPTAAERRQLTVMFVDLVGSTALAATLDPEDMGAVIRAYHGCCTAVVERWGGHVAKYMGDGVLAYFGWPQAHEDEAERAVRAGLELVEAVSALNASRLALGGGREEGQTLAARVGIATGLVMVGELIGEGAAQEQTVVGETPNLAARLQALAKPGSVVISQATRRLVGQLFELADLGPRRLKGFAEPLPAWRVEGAGRAESRFEALHGEHLTPLVGREHELGILLERWAWAKDRDGQVVLLSGEPGIGKSRLIRTLRERLGDEPYTPLSHYCSPYHTNSALYPVIRLLERAAGFAPEDGAKQRLDRLEALLARSTERLREAVPLIAALLSLPTGERYPPLALSPQQQKQRTLAILVDQLAGLAARQPVLAMYEDVHWIDPTTLELLDLVIERVRRLPVLVVITFRPEFNPPWRGQAHITALPLNRLGRRQGAAIVQRLTGGKALPEEVLEQILAKTDGVPLFVEELTKTVLESGLLGDTGDHYELTGPLPPLAIPATLHDSLMARLDRLAPVKEVAQTAAVIGREFSHDLLAAVSPLPASELDAALDQLVAAELIFRRGTPPDVSYAFKHALVQDAAHQSLLKSKRQRLHARIAQVLEERFPDTAPEILAHHCDEAGLAERAVLFWRRAGTAALERSAINEAVAHLNHGLASLVDLPPGSSRDDMELDIQIALAAAHMAARGYAAEETERTHMRAHELLRGDDPRQFAVLYALFVARWNLAQLHDALATAMELLERAQRQRDPAPLCVAYRSAAVAQNVLGEFAIARRNAITAWELYKPEAHARSALEYGHDIGVAALMHVALADWFLGFPKQAQRSAHQAVALAEDLGHANTRGYAQFWHCWLHLLARDAPALEAQATALVRFADEQFMANWSAVGRALSGAAQVLQGSPGSGIELLDTGITGMESARTRGLAHFLKGVRAEALAHLGRVDEGLALLEQTLDFARGAGLHWSEAEHQRLRGALSLQKTPPDQEAAEACFESAIDMARTQEAKLLELRAETSLALLWAEQGERQRARDLVGPVYGWFTEGFDTADLRDAKTLLDQLA